MTSCRLELKKYDYFFQLFSTNFRVQQKTRVSAGGSMLMRRARSSSIDRDGGDDDDDVDVDDGIDIDVIRRPMRCVDGGLDHYTKT